VKSLCMTILYLVPVKKVTGLIPEPLRAAEVIPGFTVGGFYAARYGSRSGQAVSEFGLMPAYVRLGDKKGFFMRHFCMDNRPAKEGCSCGNFSWKEDGKSIALDVSSEESGLVSIRMRPVLNNIPFTGALPFLYEKGNNIVYLQNHLISRIGVSFSKVTLPEDSPIKGFPFGPKLVTAFWDTSNIVYKEPELTAQRAALKRENILGTPMGNCRR
jgi:hypothetical protein